MAPSIYIDTETTTETTISLLKGTDSSNYNQEREMLNIWEEVIESGNNRLKLTEKRIKLLSDNLKNYFNNDVNLWKEFCLKISTSKFLMGEITSFKAQLDWVINENNLVKILENSYGIGDRDPKNNLNDVSENKTNLDLLIEIKKSNEPKLFRDIKVDILNQLGAATYISWFKEMKFVRCEKGILQITTASKFKKDYLVQNYEDKVAKICSKLVDNFCRLEINVAKI